MQNALGTASRRTGCYWSREETGRRPGTGRSHYQTTRKNTEVHTERDRKAGQRASSVPTHSWERRGGSRKRWKSPGTANLSASGSPNRDLWIRHLKPSAPRQPALIVPSSSFF